MLLVNVSLCSLDVQQEKCDVFLPAHFFGWWAKVRFFEPNNLLIIINTVL